MPNVQHFIPGETDRVWQTKKMEKRTKTTGENNLFLKIVTSFLTIAKLYLRIVTLYLVTTTYKSKLWLYISVSEFATSYNCGFFKIIYLWRFCL